MRIFRMAALACAGLLVAGPALALDLTKKRENLPDLVLGDVPAAAVVFEDRSFRIVDVQRLEEAWR